MESIANPWLWGAFFAIVIVMLAIDLFIVGGGKEHKVSFKEAGIWSIIWVSITFIFAGGMWWYIDESLGRDIANLKTTEFITGYFIEKSLAIDNVFVWLMIFSAFAIPLQLQKRVLLYGIVGAIVMRTIMIFVGAWLITQFHWILYVFGAFLLFTGIKMWFAADNESDFNQSKVVLWLRRHFKITQNLEGEKFFTQVKEGTKWVLYATPLFLVLVLVEISDLIFAVDSIPAIFAITKDPFIVLTSNIFAILGLRAMYFMLADMADRFALLKYGLALVLVFVGTKMILIDLYKIPVLLSLAVIATIITTSVLLSLYQTRKPSALK